jgi:hypothetical protein
MAALFSMVQVMLLLAKVVLAASNIVILAIVIINIYYYIIPSKIVLNVKFLCLGRPSSSSRGLLPDFEGFPPPMLPERTIHALNGRCTPESSMVAKREIKIENCIFFCED